MDANANECCELAINLIAAQSSDGLNRQTVLQRDVRLWLKLEANRVARGNITMVPMHTEVLARSGGKVTATSHTQSFIARPQRHEGSV